MLLAPHLLVGAALAKFIPSPPLALTAAFLSHYLLDQTPHWHYFPDAEHAGQTHPLEKPLLQSGMKGLAPLVRVGADIALGAGLVFLAQPQNLFLLLGGFLAIFPDGLLYLSWQFPKANTLLWHQTLHNALHHNPHNDSAWPLGLPLQTAVALGALFLLLLV